MDRARVEYTKNGFEGDIQECVTKNNIKGLVVSRCKIKVQ